MNRRDARLTVPIAGIEQESPTVKTLRFEHPLSIEPGQFVMVTDYEHGEKPFSPSSSTDSGFSLTIREVGPFTRALCGAHVGDIVSVRGPFGSSFFVPTGATCLVIGGGCGTPPLFHLSCALVGAGNSVTVVNGAKTADEVLFSHRFRALDIELFDVSEDGLLSRTGTTVPVAVELMERLPFDHAYVAGPELMMLSLLPVLEEHGVASQFLLERYMKCGIGICGSCAMDPDGFRVCVEGPVVDAERLKALDEFGSYHRNASGQIEGIGGCAWNG